MLYLYVYNYSAILKLMSLKISKYFTFRNVMLSAYLKTDYFKFMYCTHIEYILIQLHF